MSGALGELISRHGKMVFAVWVVAILVLAPSAVKVLEHTGYTIQDMADNDSGSAVATGVVSRYFDPAEVPLERIPMLVVSYDSHGGYLQLQGDPYDDIPRYSDFLAGYISQDPDWSIKLDLVQGGCELLRTYGDDTSGALLLGFHYLEIYDPIFVENDTANLRTIVSEATDEYMFQMYQGERLFETMVTGGGALSDDMQKDLKDTLYTLVPLLLLLIIILMGIFFGSAMTALIAVTSIVFGIVVMASSIFGVSAMVPVFSTAALLVIVIGLILVLAHCILIVNKYKLELKSGKTPVDALDDTVSKVAKPIVASCLCIVAFGVVLSFGGVEMITGLGICLSICSILVMCLSLTVPTSLIGITQNELFWTRRSDGRVKVAALQRAYDRVKGLASRSGQAMCDLKLGVRLTILITISIMCVLCASFVLSSNASEEMSSDITDLIVIGESREGLETLEQYGEGGLIHPYKVVIGYGMPVGDITECGGEGYGPPYKAITWSSDTLGTDIQSIRGQLEAGAVDNLSFTSSVFIWSDMVAKARSEGISDPTGIVDHIMDSDKDWLTQRALDRYIPALRLTLGDQALVETGGPRVDYLINMALGSVGYQLTADGRVVITHVMVTTVSKSNTTDGKGTVTTDAILDVAKGFADGRADIAGTWVNGIGVIVKELYGPIEGNFVFLTMAVCVALLVVLVITTGSVLAPFMSLLTTGFGLFVSITGALLLGSIHGLSDISFIALMILPIAAIGIGTWFNLVQIGELQESEDVRTMEKRTNPPMVVSCIILVGMLALLSLSNISIVSQTAQMLVVVAIVDIVMIRLLLSPIIWSLTGGDAFRPVPDEIHQILEKKQ